MTGDTQQTQTRLDGLIRRGEQEGCVNLSELNDMADELGLGEDEAAEMHEALEARGIEVTDDCGR
jgi:RNA polymerase primary sigma factor